MQEREVTDFYRAMEHSGITVWIDGGWGVDALLGKQTRPIAIWILRFNKKTSPIFGRYRNLKAIERSSWKLPVRTTSCLAMTRGAK